MKALGIAFSARKRGNCLSSIEYVLAELKKQRFETEAITFMIVRSNHAATATTNASPKA